MGEKSNMKNMYIEMKREREQCDMYISLIHTHIEIASVFVLHIQLCAHVYVYIYIYMHITHGELSGRAE